jgi:hemin uptake protein HemP
MMTCPTSATPPAPAPQSADRHCIDSKTLLKGATALEIEHSGQRYVLRITRENKLILTK